MNAMKKWLGAMLILCFLWGVPALGENVYTTLKQGDTGEAVQALKQRMYELGYFTSTKFSVEFNATTKERLIQLQKKNGLTADGIATPEVQAFIFSDQCLPKSAPDAAKKEEQTAEAEILSMDFLPEGAKPTYTADRAKGVWTYVSSSLHVEIRQRTGKSPWGANLWLEASVKYKDPGQWLSMTTNGKKSGNRMMLPADIIKLYGDPAPIFTVSDDYFGYRAKYIADEKHVGVIIRNGEILFDDPKTAIGKKFPPLDVMAVFEDGSMKTFRNGEHTAQEYLDMGVRHAYSFGPILVQDGKVYDGYPEGTVWSDYGQPRLGIGVTADGTVKILNVLGRRTDAKGVSIGWMAEKMQEMGCTEALNLDGGNTISLIFMGDMINRPVKTAQKDIRPVTGLIAIMDGADE